MPDITFADGPLDELTYTVDDPSKGVLVVDKEAGQTWLYASTDGATYRPRIDGDADPATGARPYDADQTVEAVSNGYVVIAVPGDAPDQDDLDADEDTTDGE